MCLLAVFPAWCHGCPQTNTRDTPLGGTCTLNCQIPSGGWDNGWLGGDKTDTLGIGKIGVAIISTGNTESVTMVGLAYVLVKWVAGCVDTPTCYRPSPSECPAGSLAKTMWLFRGSGLMTTPLPKAKAWIGSPIIAVHADPSDYLWTNRHLPGMAGTPDVCRWWTAHHVGLESLVQE